MNKQRKLKADIAKHFGYNYHRVLAVFDESFHPILNAIWEDTDLVPGDEMKEFTEYWQKIE